MDLSLVLFIHRLDGIVTRRQVAVGDWFPVLAEVVHVAVADARPHWESVVGPSQIAHHLIIAPDGLQPPQRHFPAHTHKKHILNDGNNLGLLLLLTLEWWNRRSFSSVPFSASLLKPSGRGNRWSSSTCTWSPVRLRKGRPQIADPCANVGSPFRCSASRWPCIRR